MDTRFCPSCGFDLAEVDASDGDPYEGLILADKYIIEDLIGEGAMGRVYIAKQLTLGKPFAAKILAPHLLNDDQSHARFANEAHNAASLNHPNCVSVVDYGRTPDGITYIVMEYIKGLTLEQIIAEQFPLPRERIVDLVLQILAALAEAHGLGILHRDLKPENILVQQLRTHGELAKVLDFGIAKLMEEQSSSDAGLTSQGMVCGTPEYMSPEQARGHKLDARSDLYAVGVILYQALTGRPPFESASAVEILHKHLHEDPIPPSELLGAEPDPLEAVCLRAMAKDPNNRYANAAEFREELIAATSAQAPGMLKCTECGADMRPEHKFCPSCGKAAPSEDAGANRRRHPSRGSGMMMPSQTGEPTAEVVVRNFPLPLAGREHAFERARALLSRPQPTIRVRCLAGPRGIGKTRMADEIASLAETLGWRAYYVGADPSGAQTSLWPIQAMVAQLLEFDPHTVTTQDLGRVANLSGLAFEELPGLAELFGLHGPAHDLEYGVRKRECYASAVQALLSGGRGQPLLLVFDDMDRYDASSREILSRLHTARASAAVVVMTTTTETSVDWLGGVVEVLEPLGRDVVERLGHAATIEVNPNSRLPSALADVAPLSPLKLENHLRLLAMGVQAPGRSSKEELIKIRIDNLPGAWRQTLELAAVLGERFVETDLVDLFEATASGGTSGQFDEALAGLHVGGILLIVGSGERAFAHALLHQVTYQSIPDDRRTELHLHAARTSRVARLSVTARSVHQVRAGLPEAIETLAEAAEQAERAFDDPSAGDYLSTALALISKLPHDHSQRGHEVPLTLDAARVMRGGAQSGNAIRLIEDQLVAKGLRAPDEARLLRALGRAQGRAERFDEAIVSLKKGLGPAIATGDAAMMAKIYHELGRVYAAKGDHERALSELTEGLDMFTLGEGPRAVVDLDLWKYLLKVSDVARRSGNAKDARTWCEHALWQAERRSDKLGMLRCHAQMAWVLRELKQQALAEQHLARALEEARHFGDRLTTAELLIERARARAARGRLTEAKRCCEEALRLARGIQWARGIEHAERAIAMLTRNAPAPATPPAEAPPSSRDNVMRSDSSGG